MENFCGNFQILEVISFLLDSHLRNNSIAVEIFLMDLLYSHLRDNSIAFEISLMAMF